MGAKWNYTLLALLAFICVKAQVNLVPNPSFEEYYQIPCNTGPTINYCKNWFSATSGGASPDYYSRFIDNGCYNGIPQNDFGYEEPKDGDFYAGIYTYQTNILNAVEYIECKLTSVLLPKRYCVNYYVSLADSASSYTVNNIGLFFSNDSIFFDSPRLSKCQPQFVNSSNFLTNKIGWTKISGSFVAQGGEKYMIIGNFNEISNDDTLHVEGVGNNWVMPKSAYIYIDSVSVTLCDDVGVEENKLDKINIHPNPAQDFVSIDLPKNINQAQLGIYNLIGQLVSQKQIAQANQTVPITELGNGVYVFVVESGGEVVGRRRVVVAR